MVFRVIYKISFLLVFITTDAFCQELINYTPDSHWRSVTHLSKKLNFIYGLDNQSVDYYKTINSKYSVFYNLESETFSLKNDVSNLVIDRLELFKIKGIKHNERTLTKLNSTLHEVNYKGINTSFMGRIKQITNTLYNYGLVRTKNGTSLLQIHVDTLNYKLTYDLIPVYDKNFNYFPKKSKKDTVFSSSLFEGTIHQVFSFKGDKIIKSSTNPVRLKGESNLQETYFVSNNLNPLKAFNKINGPVLDVLNTDTILSINIDSNAVYYYDSSYSLQNKRNIKLDSSLKKMELKQKEILTDPITSNKFIHLKFKKDSLIDVFYNLNDLTKCAYKITSIEWYNNIDIRNNSILIDVVHPIDKHIYIYGLIKKINSTVPNNITLLFPTTSSFNLENNNTSLCGGTRSLFYDKLFKEDKKYITDTYEVLDRKKINITKELTDTVLETNQETLNQLIETIIAHNEKQQYLAAVSELFIYKKNSSDTLIYKLINERNYDDIKKGVNDITEQLMKITDMPQKTDFDKMNEAELYTIEGNILTFIKLKHKWYCTARYYKKAD